MAQFRYILIAFLAMMSLKVSAIDSLYTRDLSIANSDGAMYSRVERALAARLTFADQDDDKKDKRYKDSLRREARGRNYMSTEPKKKKEKEVDLDKKPFITLRDTMPLSRVAWMSMVLPGFGQLYNRQYWKIPVLYGVAGTLVGLGVNANKKYKDYKTEYNRTLDMNYPQDIVDLNHTRMKRYETQRTLFFVGAVATYLYFVGDAALHYRGKENNVKKATTLSMIFPGLGQIYNRSYWKLPIIYGGFATMGYIIDWNNRGYKRYREAYNRVTDGDPTTIDEFKGHYTADQLRSVKDSYRRNRDLSIILTGLFYILNIVDANVDATMKKFDISDDLSMRFEPSVIETRCMSAYSNRNYGLSLSIRF